MKAFATALSVLVVAGTAAAGQHHKRIDHPNSKIAQMNNPSDNKACGYTVTENAAAVHVPKAMWRNGENCGQWMQINSGGKQEYAMVTGQCSDCQGNDLDVSPATYQALGGAHEGATWKFMNKKFTPDMDVCP